MSERTNAERATVADAAIEASLLARGDNHLYVTGEEGAVDLIVDVLHWCDREGIDVRRVLAMAELHWDAERNPQPVRRNTEYLIIRHGTNGEREAVAIVEATSRAEACDKAVSEPPKAGTRWGGGSEPLPVAVGAWGETLEAVPRSRARASEWNDVLAFDGMYRTE